MFLVFLEFLLIIYLFVYFPYLSCLLLIFPDF